MRKERSWMCALLAVLLTAAVLMPQAWAAETPPSEEEPGSVQEEGQPEEEPGNGEEGGEEEETEDATKPGVDADVSPSLDQLFTSVTVGQQVTGSQLVGSLTDMFGNPVSLDDLTGDEMVEIKDEAGTAYSIPSADLVGLLEKADYIIDISEATGSPVILVINQTNENRPEQDGGATIPGDFDDEKDQPEEKPGSEEGSGTPESPAPDSGEDSNTPEPPAADSGEDSSTPEPPAADSEEDSSTTEPPAADSEEDSSTTEPPAVDDEEDSNTTESPAADSEEEKDSVQTDKQENAGTAQKQDSDGQSEDKAETAAKSSTETPKTGDEAQPLVWILLAVISTVGIVALCTVKRNTRSDDERLSK